MGLELSPDPGIMSPLSCLPDIQYFPEHKKYVLINIRRGTFLC